MRYLLVSTFMICCAVAPRLCAGGQVEIQFEDLVAGTTYSGGDLPAFLFSESYFFTLYGSGGTGASGRIGTDNYAGHTGNELELFANLRAELFMGFGAIDVSFNFAELGGTNLLEVNGATVELSDVAFLGPGSVGGVSYNASFVGGGGLFGAFNVQFDGSIYSLAVIGEELAIDNVRMNIVPEPSSVALLTAGLVGLALVWRRKRRR